MRRVINLCVGIIAALFGVTLLSQRPIHYDEKLIYTVSESRGRGAARQEVRKSGRQMNEDEPGRIAAQRWIGFFFCSLGGVALWDFWSSRRKPLLMFEPIKKNPKSA
jgi:hypothetical protein